METENKGVDREGRSVRGQTVRGATTDQAGAFAVALSQAGRYSLRAARLGYSTVVPG